MATKKREHLAEENHLRATPPKPKAAGKLIKLCFGWRRREGNYP